LPTLYLDNNVYDHMLKEYPSAGDLKRLLAGKERAKGTIVTMSLENLNEFIPLLSTDVEMFKDAVRLMKAIVDWDRPLKPLRYLLIEDVQSFARYGKCTSSFSPPGTTVRKLMKHALNALHSLSAQDIVELQRVGRQQAQDGIEFKHGMGEARAHVRGIVKNSGMRFRSFEAMWSYCLKDETIIRHLLEPHAREAGRVRQCSRRGFVQMLEIPSIRMAVGCSLSFIYWMAFRRRDASRRDAGDHHHTIYSSAVDVFVSEDAFLRKLLIPIPDRPVEVLSIKQAVEWLQNL
jgi:hypothetical protein